MLVQSKNIIVEYNSCFSTTKIGDILFVSDILSAVENADDIPPGFDLCIVLSTSSIPNKLHLICCNFLGIDTVKNTQNKSKFGTGYVK